MFMNFRTSVCIFFILCAGQPKLANIPPLPVQGQFQGGPPNNMMNMGPQGQVPQGFPGGPLPPASGGVNGFVPPMPQGFVPQGPMGMNRPLGPPPSVGSGAPPSQPPSNFRPPVSGQHVPPSSCNSSLPPTGAGQTLNGTNTPPFGQPPSIFPPPQLTGKSPGPPQLAFTSAQAPSGQRGPPPRMAVPPAGGSGSAPFVSANSTSGTSTPTSGHLSKPFVLWKLLAVFACCACTNVKVVAWPQATLLICSVWHRHRR